MTPPTPVPALAFIPGKKREEQRGGGEGPVSHFSSLLPPFTKTITSHHHSSFIQAFSVRSREAQVQLSAGAWAPLSSKTRVPFHRNLQRTPNHSFATVPMCCHSLRPRRLSPPLRSHHSSISRHCVTLEVGVSGAVIVFGAATKDSEALRGAE